MMKEQTCCFTGHRAVSGADMVWLPERLNQVIQTLYEKGVRRFCCGGALGFDTLAAETVLAFRRRYPGIQLSLILPCKEQDKFWNAPAKRQYGLILAQADEVIYTAEQYHNGCMLSRNRRMVDESRYCISYLKRNTGGTAYTVRYAGAQGCTVLNLCTL